MESEDLRTVVGSLGSYETLEYLEGSTLENLKLQLNQLTLPSKIISIYMDGTKHVAWVLLTAGTKIKKVSKNKKGI